jgi:N-acylneuraminate cytidylyltransferase/CMP-N,N'-diacetyllegionaminic acid synthase
MIDRADISTSRYLAIILARAGSKGLPGKNVLPLGGKPLIAHTIEAARSAHSIQRIVVSTESEQIAQIAQQYGAEVPFLRPADLARDETPVLRVLQHVLKELTAVKSHQPEIIVLLQPTSPLRRAEDIDRAVTLLEQTQADSVVSLCAAEHHPAWMKRIEGDHVRPFLENGPEYTRRQDLPPVYRVNGAIYVTRARVLLHENAILGRDTRALVMDSESSVDIDTLLDLKLAELILQERQNGSA